MDTLCCSHVVTHYPGYCCTTFSVARTPVLTKNSVLFLSLMITWQISHWSSCKWPDCAFHSHQNSAFQSCSSETAVSKLSYTCQPYPCLVQHKDEHAESCSVCKYTLLKSFITTKRGYQQIIPVRHSYQALLGINQKS